MEFVGEMTVGQVLSENYGSPLSITILPIFYIQSPIIWSWYGTIEILAATIPRESVAHHCKYL
jgi:hypothetical protein